MDKSLIGKRITVDYDGLKGSFINLIRICNFKDEHIVSKKFRLSSSKTGTHLEIIYDRPLGFSERIDFREKLNDCEIRIKLDKDDYAGARDTDVLYYSKGRNVVGSWYELTQENINKVINTEPFWR